MIEESAKRMAAGVDPGIIPERFLIGAARVALNRRMAGRCDHEELLPRAGEEITVALESTFQGLGFVCLGCMTRSTCLRLRWATNLRTMGRRWQTAWKLWFSTSWECSMRADSRP